MDSRLINVVSQALDFDSLGCDKDASDRYLEALRMIFQQTAVDDQQLVIAQECIERLREIEVYKKDGNAESIEKELEDCNLNAKDDSWTVGTLKEQNLMNARDRSASISRSLSQMRRRHETEMIAAQERWSQEVLSKERDLHLQRIMKSRSSFRSASIATMESVLERGSKVLNGYVNMFVKAVNWGVRGLDVEMQVRLQEAAANAERSLESQKTIELSDYAVIDAVVQQLSMASDPISEVIRLFIRRWRDLLEDTSFASEEAALDFNTGVAKNANIQLVMGEMRKVEQHVIDLLKEDIAAVLKISTCINDGSNAAAAASLDVTWANQMLSGSIRLSLQHFIHTTAMSQLLLEQIRDGDEEAMRRDALLTKAIASWRWQNLAEHLKLPVSKGVVRSMKLHEHGRAFPMSLADGSPISAATVTLMGLCSRWTPMDKLTCMTQCCVSLNEQVASVMMRMDGDDDSSQEEEFVLGSDDLVLLVSYVIVCANVRYLATQLAFVSMLIPDELLKGHAGFMLATFETAIDYIISQHEQ